MTISTVAALLGAFTSALLAEEALLNTALQAPAEQLRTIIEAIRGNAREAIEAAAAAPGDAFALIELLRQAVDLDGPDSPLVARVASALANAAAPPASAISA